MSWTLVRDTFGVWRVETGCQMNSFATSNKHSFLQLKINFFSQIDGCYFHFTQSLRKKVSELGLVNPYRNYVILKSVIRKLMAMGFLPLNFITGTFYILSTSKLVRPLMITYPALVEFFSYFRDNCILRNSNFPPYKWKCLWGVELVSELWGVGLVECRT